MTKRLYILALCVLLPLISFGQKKDKVGTANGTNNPALLKIVVSDEKREPLVGATIFNVDQAEGFVSDVKGRISTTLACKPWLFRFSYIGYETQEVIVDLFGDGTLYVKLKEEFTTLDEVVVSSRAADANVKSTDIGRQVMSIETIESLPPFVGEVDILKSIVLLPGVNTVGEASSGFNIRGSSTDQNLILLGGATLYNPSHLFGFFSAFNTDLIQDVTIFKGGIPAKYGGRAASIIDLKYKRGNVDGWEGKGSLGMVSAKVSAGGPIIPGKLTLMVGGRVSYSNWILNSVNNASIKNSNAQFYDGNVLLDYDISDKTLLKYKFYKSNDEFSFASDTSFSWSNLNHVVELGHSFSEKLNLNAQFAIGTYNFSILDEFKFTSFKLNSKILDKNGQIGLTYYLNDNHTLYGGVQNKWLTIEPGNLTKNSSESSISPKSVQKENATESSAYLQHEFEVGKVLGISYGMRYNLYRFLGPNSVAEYLENFPRSEENISNVINYGEGEEIVSYDGFEPRASLRVSFGENTSLKLGYNLMYQYIHLVSNTSTIAPTDTWKLSDPFLKPQKVTQYSAGIFKNFLSNSIETSFEVFYKDLSNILDYKDGAQLILNDFLEADLINGRGKSWGLEAYIHKKTGKMTGWISYTYSTSERQVIGSYPEETINGGNWYKASYDIPHSLSIVGEYKLSNLVQFSSIFTYNSGRPVTYPAAKFIFNGQNVAYYDERNSFRAPNYHRLDLSMTFGFKSRKKLFQGDFVFSIYNVYGRKNAFSVFFDDVVGNPPQAYRLSVLGTAFPSISYNFDF